MTTAKHLNELNGTNIKQKTCNKYCCEICNRLYAAASRLWKHKIICKIADNTELKDNKNKADEPTDKELIMMIIKLNTELTKRN